MLASRDDPGLRSSVVGLVGGTTVGVGSWSRGSFLDGWRPGGALVAGAGARPGEPYLFGSEGWKLVPGHFAERHGLIILIALGESIVAIGVGAEVRLDAGIAAAAAFGIGLTAALWWIYFDVVALVATRRLGRRRPGGCRTRWRATPTPTSTS